MRKTSGDVLGMRGGEHEGWKTGGYEWGMEMWQ